MDKIYEGIIQSKPIKCVSCEGKVVYMGNGRHQCKRCGRVMYDNYGKVRKYLRKNKKASFLEIERETGVSQYMLEELIEDGVLIDPPEDWCDAVCAGCGFPILGGRYCRTCKLDLSQQISGALQEGDSSQGKNAQESKISGKMHFRKKT